MPKAARIIISLLIILPSLVIIISTIASSLFHQSAAKEVKELFADIKNDKKIITKEDLAGLPLCVQNWLEHSQVVGKEKILAVRLKQKGLMRLEEGKPWMPVEAEQYFSVEKPAFIWIAKIKAAPFVNIIGRDKYFKGHGHMLIKLLSLITLADSRGKGIDQGTLLRYMAEMPWFPTAALSNCITWEEIDSNRAKATMSYGGVTASGVFEFNEKGELVSFTANRYRELKGTYVLQGWGGITRGYREFNGIRIPNNSDVIWKPETGDFNWFKCEITEIEYNKPVMY